MHVAPVYAAPSGIGQTNRLSVRLTAVKSDSSAKKEGTKPERELELRKTVWREKSIRVPSSSGMVPEKELEDRSNSPSARKESIVEGIVPLIKFKSSFKECKSKRLTKEDGIVPGDRVSAEGEKEGKITNHSVDSSPEQGQ